MRPALARLIILEAAIVLDTVYATRLSFSSASQAQATREHTTSSTLTPAIGMLKEPHSLSATNEALQMQAPLHAACHGFLGSYLPIRCHLTRPD